MHFFFKSGPELGWLLGKFEMRFQPHDVNGAVPGFNALAKGYPSGFAGARSLAFGAGFSGELLEPFVGEFVGEVHVTGSVARELQTAVQEVFCEVCSDVPKEQAALLDAAAPVDVHFLNAIFDVLLTAWRSAKGKDVAVEVAKGEIVDGLCEVTAGVDGCRKDAQGFSAGVLKFGIK